MTRQLAWAVVGDGGTDAALLPILQWAIHRLDPSVEVLEPEFVKRHGSVAGFLSSFRTGAMVTFVHRDAESVSLEVRLREFEGIDRDDVIPVVTVRMTEAWLLVDGSAIARAASNPTAEVDVPPLGQLENLANPKAMLEDLLFKASGSPSGRRGKTVRASLPAMRVNVASYISTFEPLEVLPAFASFQRSLKEVYPYRDR